MIFCKTDNNPLLLANDYNDDLDETTARNTSLHKISSVNKFTIAPKIRNILTTIKDNKHKKLYNIQTKITHSIDPKLRTQERKVNFFMIPKSDKFGTKLNIAVAILPNDLLFKKDFSSNNGFKTLRNNCTNVFANIPKTYNDFYPLRQKNIPSDIDKNTPYIKNKTQYNENNDSTIYIYGGNLELICPIILDFMGCGYSMFCIHSTINIIQFYKNDDILDKLFRCNDHTELCDFNLILSDDDKNNATFFNVPKKYVFK
jgi:hypothetical protein